MEKYFYSKQNILTLTKKLIIFLELEENEINTDVITKCQKIITNFMQAIFNKYGKRKPSNMTTEIFLDKLNKKSLSECLRTFNKRKQKLVVFL